MSKRSRARKNRRWTRKDAVKVPQCQDEGMGPPLSIPEAIRLGHIKWVGDKLVTTCFMKYCPGKTENFSVMPKHDFDFDPETQQ